MSGCHQFVGNHCVIPAAEYEICFRTDGAGYYFLHSNTLSSNDNANPTTVENQSIEVFSSGSAADAYVRPAARYRFAVDAAGFAASNTYKLWLRMECVNFNPAFRYGVNGVNLGTISSTTRSSLIWVAGSNFTVSRAARHEFTLGFESDEVRLNELIVTRDLSYTPSGWVAPTGYYDRKGAGDYDDPWPGHVGITAADYL